MPQRSSLPIYLTAVVLYLFAAWLHIPYGGGHIYSDIVTVFQVRECPSGCTLPVPYVQTFVEYPVIASMFIYSMGLLAKSVGGDLLTNYYILTSAFLLIPTLLLIRELLKLAEMVQVKRSRVLRYFVVTPSFLIMLLLNWYVIGVFFAVYALRIFLEGSRFASGVLLGLSAAANLVTALPALGLTLSSRTLRDGMEFVAGGLTSFGLVNAPFVVSNPSLWFSFWQYHYNWYIEGSWMLAFLDLFSPLRHQFAIAVFVIEAAIILVMIRRTHDRDPLQLSWILTFAFLFSSYVYTPQMNMILLPFFALAPIARHYVEFLVFDLINSLVIILAYSQALLVFGTNYAFSVSYPLSLIGIFVIGRSLWTGKFAMVDGIRKIGKRSTLE